MSSYHDTLVLRLKQSANCMYIKDIFIFYDYKTRLFGIRGQNIGDFTNTDGSFALDSSNIEITIDFLSTILQSNCSTNYIEISFLSLKTLPIKPKRITRDTLVEYASDSRYCTSLKQKETFASLPRKKMEKYLHILINVFTEY